jgi:hypothetical protein
MKSTLAHEITTLNLALLTLAIGLLKNPAMHGDPKMNRFSLGRRQAADLSSFSDERARQVSRCGRSLFVPVCHSDGKSHKDNAHHAEPGSDLFSAYYYDLLVLIRECSRTRPFEAVWRFNLPLERLNRMACTPLADLRGQSRLSSLKLCILPREASGTVSPMYHAALYDCRVFAIH